MRKNILVATGAVIASVIIVTVSLMLTARAPAQPPAHHHVTAAAAAPTPSVDPVPSPGGTATGSCDYTLGDNPAGDPGTAVATGEVDLTSTGNIGAYVKVTMTWPQEGYAPLSQSKTVQMPYNASGMAVPFSYPLTYDQISNLQDWQQGHGYADGCTYTETITGTYGQVNG